jgi:anti-sigma regulatory factor (Ser/Thr protein kinase)
VNVESEAPNRAEPDAAPAGGAVLTLELPNQAEAVGAARNALTSLNGNLHLVSAERLRDVQLLTSELVANAHRHGGLLDASVHVSVLATDDLLRVEVRDLGDGFDPASLRPPAGTAAGGWGLHLVGILASRWGVARGSGTTVWFEVDRPSRERPIPT